MAHGVHGDSGSEEHRLHGVAGSLDTSAPSSTKDGAASHIQSAGPDIGNTWNTLLANADVAKIYR